MADDVDSLLYARSTPPESLAVLDTDTRRSSCCGQELAMPSCAQNQHQKLPVAGTCKPGPPATLAFAPPRPAPDRRHIQPQPAAFGSSGSRFPTGLQKTTAPPVSQRRAVPPPPIAPKPQMDVMTVPPSADILTILVQELLTKFDEQRTSIDELRAQVKLLLSRNEGTEENSAPQPTSLDVSASVAANDKIVQAVCAKESVGTQVDVSSTRNVRIQHCTPCYRCGYYSSDLLNINARADAAEAEFPLVQQDQQDDQTTRHPLDSASSDSHTTTSEEVSSDTPRTLMPHEFGEHLANTPIEANATKRKRVTYAADEVVLRESQNDEEKSTTGRSVYVDRLALKYLSKGDLSKYFTASRQQPTKAVNVLDNRVHRENKMRACPPFGKKPKESTPRPCRPHSGNVTSNNNASSSSRPRKGVKEQYAVAMYSRVLYDYARDSDDGFSGKVVNNNGGQTQQQYKPLHSPPGHSRSFSGMVSSEVSDGRSLANRSFRDVENRSPLDNRRRSRKAEKLGLLASRRFEPASAGQAVVERQNNEQTNEPKSGDSRIWSFTNDSEEEESPMSGEDEEIAAVAGAEEDSDFSNVFSDNE